MARSDCNRFDEETRPVRLNWAPHAKERPIIGEATICHDGSIVIECAAWPATTISLRIDPPKEARRGR